MSGPYRHPIKPPEDQEPKPNYCSDCKFSMGHTATPDCSHPHAPHEDKYVSRNATPLCAQVRREVGAQCPMFEPASKWQRFIRWMA